MRQLSLLLLATFSISAANARAQTGRDSTIDYATQLEQVAEQLKNADDNLKVVETQYSERPEPSDDEAMLRRFSNGEIQYLLGDYPGASVLFYDLVADKRFRSNPKYPEALYYLAETLYQQKNLVGAKLYLRELLGLKPPRYKEVLVRYLEIAGELNDFTSIESYVDQAKELSGELSPEVAYVYGKWLFKRTDVPVEERMRQASEIFAPLAQSGPSPYRIQAAYFLGVAQVKRRDFEAAIQRFRDVLAIKATTDREKSVRALTHLSLGRLYFELQRFDDALAQYVEIPRDSEHFVDSLYEIAWTHVKKGEFEQAKNATDILLLVAPESTLAPEAQILQGHLLLKLKRYNEATDTYNLVINTYAPVGDEINALLLYDKDPVKYFDDLLAKNERNLDVASLLPPVALKWATTQREVADAVRMVSDLEQGRRGVHESEEIAQRILQALSERGLETFPALQEGYTRAHAVDSALTEIERGLVRIEAALLDSALTAEERSELARLRQSQAGLDQRFSQLPTTQAEVEERKRRLTRRVEEIDKQAFKLAHEVQSMFAVLAAIEKWIDDSRAQRQDSPEDEKAFTEKVKHELEVLTQLQNDLEMVRQRLADQKASADASLEGEDEIRKSLEAALDRQEELLARARGRAGPEARRLLGRIDRIRGDKQLLATRVATAKARLREQVARKGQQIRETIESERALLRGYRQEVNDISSDARNLVGRIAFDSFKRVRQQFYDLVLKADVGIVDVAFTRKQDKTSQIQTLAGQKDRELRALDEEFKEVLKDVD